MIAKMLMTEFQQVFISYSEHIKTFQRYCCQAITEGTKSKSNKSRQDYTKRYCNIVQKCCKKQKLGLVI